MTETPSAPGKRFATCDVAAVRLDHDRGDIIRSYSADRIASSQPVRKPFQHEGDFWICTSITGGGLTPRDRTQAEAYRLVAERMFRGTPTTYAATIGTAEAAEAARNSPDGFYHGIAVKFGGAASVLCGPPIRFVAKEAPARPNPDSPEPEQLSLF